MLLCRVVRWGRVVILGVVGIGEVPGFLLGAVRRFELVRLLIVLSDRLEASDEVVVVRGHHDCDQQVF